MEKLLISLLAAIGAYVIFILSVAASCGELDICFGWRVTIVSVGLIGFSWIFVWCRMNA